jgi:diguanylate cyclase (GGDEF)-like protein
MIDLWQTFPDALLFLDAELKCTNANPAAQAMFAPDATGSEDLEEVYSVFIQDASLTEPSRRVLQTGVAERIETVIRLETERRWLDVWIIPFPGLPGLVLSLHDISSRKQSEERLRGVAEQDSLTGLLNHAAFHDTVTRTLSQARERNQQPVLVLFDLDYLKNINDNYGHRMGDRALQLMAETLRVSTRAGDVLGRLGGDEFAWLVPDAELSVAVRLAERALAAIQATHVAPSLFLSASIGVASVTSTFEPGDLFDRADAAVYDAKAAGRGVVVVASATDIGYESRREIRDDLPPQPGPDLTLASDLATAARAALREWVHVLAASGGCIDLLDQEHGWVQACAYYRFGHDDWTLSTQVYRLDDYPSTASAIAERRPYTCRVDDREGDPAEQALLRERGFASLLLTPLIVGDTVLGIVELFDTRHRTFTANDQRTALSLAHHLAPLLALLRQKSGL